MGCVETRHEVPLIESPSSNRHGSTSLISLPRSISFGISSENLDGSLFVVDKHGAGPSQHFVFLLYPHVVIMPPAHITGVPKFEGNVLLLWLGGIDHLAVFDHIHPGDGPRTAQLHAQWLGF